ncbi:Disease resistance protein SUMM2 [Citrus sinensis]|nr:Disease resistance protein SUMM2 [Citrus sinensis]
MVKRLLLMETSLMENQIKDIFEMPRRPHLLSLFLNNNDNLSRNEVLFKLPSDISRLVSIELLDLSNSRIREMPEGLKALVNLKCLNLEYTFDLIKIPRKLIFNFSRLHVLRLFGHAITSVLYGGDELIVKELLGLKHLEVLSFTLRSSYALKSFLSSRKLQSCTQALLFHRFEDSSLDVSCLVGLKLLKLKIDYKGGQFCFQSLRSVVIDYCKELKDLTFLGFASNVKSIEVRSCFAMEEIISVGKFADVPEVMANLNPFVKLQYLQLAALPNLKSIYWKPLPFSHLKEMNVFNCDKLKKLPLESNAAKEHKLDIRGEPDWWKQLEWEDEATQNAFLPCFKPF